MIKALITGVNGFCARYLTKKLKELNSINILGIDIKSIQSKNVYIDHYVQVDILIKNKIEDISRDDDL